MNHFKSASLIKILLLGNAAFASSQPYDDQVETSSIHLALSQELISEQSLLDVLKDKKGDHSIKLILASSYIGNPAFKDQVTTILPELLKNKISADSFMEAIKNISNPVNEEICSLFLDQSLFHVRNSNITAQDFLFICYILIPAKYPELEQKKEELFIEASLIMKDHLFWSDMVEFFGHFAQKTHSPRFYESLKQHLDYELVNHTYPETVQKNRQASDVTKFFNLIARFDLDLISIDFYHKMLSYGPIQTSTENKLSFLASVLDIPMLREDVLSEFEKILAQQSFGSSFFPFIKRIQEMGDPHLNDFFKQKLSKKTIEEIAFLLTPSIINEKLKQGFGKIYREIVLETLKFFIQMGNEDQKSILKDKFLEIMDSDSIPSALKYDLLGYNLKYFSKDVQLNFAQNILQGLNALGKIPPSKEQSEIALILLRHICSSYSSTQENCWGEPGKIFIQKALEFTRVESIAYPSFMRLNCMDILLSLPKAPEFSNIHETLSKEIRKLFKNPKSLNLGFSRREILERLLKKIDLDNHEQLIARGLEQKLDFERDHLKLERGLYFGDEHNKVVLDEGNIILKQLLENENPDRRRLTPQEKDQLLIDMRTFVNDRIVMHKKVYPSTEETQNHKTLETSDFEKNVEGLTLEILENAHKNFDLISQDMKDSDHKSGEWGNVWFKKAFAREFNVLDGEDPITFGRSIQLAFDALMQNQHHSDYQ